MISIYVVAVAWLASASPGLACALEYDRAAVAAGQEWRLITGQLVHWTPAMVAADLGTLAAAGVWLESRAPVLARSVLGAALVAVGAAVQADGDIAIYRGSSGLATAMFCAAACSLGREAPRWAGLLLFSWLGKLAAEAWGGAAAAPTLPSNVIVAVSAHVAGAAAGLGTFAVARVFARRRAPLRAAEGTGDPREPGPCPDRVHSSTIP